MADTLREAPAPNLYPRLVTFDRKRLDEVLARLRYAAVIGRPDGLTAIDLCILHEVVTVMDRQVPSLWDD